MFFCCVERWINGISDLDSPLGPQFSKVHRSMSSIQVCWLVFNVVIVMARWGKLKKASWLKKVVSVFGFFGGEWWVMRRWSFDMIAPISVAINAESLIVLGIVVSVVF
uniref:Uncharacterized protein n=1 Tax=Micrurus carvalhoi TaxID=3147026 RepID=A0A2H6MXS9_9SAUR